MQKERTSVLKLHNHFPANFSPMVPKMISVINPSLRISLDSPQEEYPEQNGAGGSDSCENHIGGPHRDGFKGSG